MTMSMSMSAFQDTASGITKAITGTKSGFTTNKIQDMNSGQQLLFIFVLFILIYFTMYIGAMIFNISVVKIFPSVKTVSTMDFFGLYIVLHLLLC
jgi:hypothetical protein